MPRKNGEPTIKERMAVIETHYEHIRDGIDRIDKKLDIQNGTILAHEKRISRNGAMIKAIIALPTLGGGLYGLINFLG